MQLQIEILNFKNRVVGADKSIYSLSYSFLYSVALRYVLNDEIAKDILQETYIKIFKALPIFEYKNDNATYYWMKQICTNEAIKHLNKSKRRQGIESSLMMDKLVFNDHDLHVKDLYGALKHLPENQRLVFNLFAIEGYSHKEIGEALNITEVHSRTLLKRARKCLVQKLSKEHYVTI